MGGKKKEPEPHKIFVMTTVLRSLESERPISQKYQAQRHILKSKFKEQRIILLNYRLINMFFNSFLSFLLKQLVKQIQPKQGAEQKLIDSSCQKKSALTLRWLSLESGKIMKTVTMMQLRNVIYHDSSGNGSFAFFQQAIRFDGW